MTAISKAWVSISDTAVDPDSPIDQALMQGMRDDLVHLREWVGAGFFAGAVQDHDHDGANSKPIAGEVGSIKPWPGIALPGSGLWGWCDGLTLSRATYPTLKSVLMKEATVTLTIASPCVVTWVAHGLRTNHPIRFFTTGALPTGITAGTHGGPTAGTQYYVKVLNADTFEFSATVGGASVNTSGTQSGTHTGTVAPHGDGDGSTTFHKPDYRGRVPVGRDDMGGTAANLMTAAGAGIEGRVQGRNGGAQTVTLSTAGMPAHAHTTQRWQGGGSPNSGFQWNVALNATVDFPGGSTVGSSAAHTNTQPSIIDDWIIRIQ